MSDPTYIIGIDLGTTNSVVAYTELAVPEGDHPHIHIFKIPQLVGPGSIGERETLPSFLLIPGPHDIPDGGLTVPWSADGKIAVGEYARDRGAEIPQRLIASSKSWLCHTGIDRKKAILPWGSPDDQPRMSPVEASAAILVHIKQAWNYLMAGNDENLRLENQEIFLTVPASFDVVARNLTVEAAEMAGYPQITLIEEPQAAFYAWIDSAGDEWRKQVCVGDKVLVVDIGGGTTDFSLIQVSEDNGELLLERVAVGEHLLIGGDNMDLTLAYAVAAKMASQGRKLNAYQMRGLSHGCRVAKEHLFRDPQLAAAPITILGRGSSLIGGTVKTEVSRDDVENVLTNGFFPACGSDARPKVQRRSGMRELGLAYSADPAITHHLAQFLSQQENKEEGLLCPTAVVFNGGVMKGSALKNRIIEILSGWCQAAGNPAVREITGSNLDLAVARGAAYYGLARRGKGIRIRGGLARSYYIGVEAALPAVPGIPTPVKALCVAPFGMEEGTEADIPKQEFGLVVGEPVSFEFLGSRTRHHDEIGTIVEDWGGEIEEITTLETSLAGEAGTVLAVTLQVRITEIGTLEIWCVPRGEDHRYKLEFNVREKEEREDT